MYKIRIYIGSSRETDQLRDIYKFNIKDVVIFAKRQQWCAKENPNFRL